MKDAPTPKREKLINVELSNINRIANELSDVVNTLESKISPILMPEESCVSPGPETVTAGPPLAPPLIPVLQDIYRMLLCTLDRLASIQARIEIE